MAICTALKSSNINLPEGRVILSLAYKMQNKGRDNSSLALKVLGMSMSVLVYATVSKIAPVSRSHKTKCFQAKSMSL